MWDAFPIDAMMLQPQFLAGLLLWVVLSVAVGILAPVRGGSGVGWALLSLMVSPVLTGILVALTGPLRAAKTDAAKLPVTKICPRCGACPVERCGSQAGERWPWGDLARQ